MSNSVLKWNTTGLMKVRVAVLRSGVRKLAPIETATNNNATSAQPKRCRAACIKGNRKVPKCGPSL